MTSVTETALLFVALIIFEIALLTFAYIFYIGATIRMQPIRKLKRASRLIQATNPLISFILYSAFYGMLFLALFFIYLPIGFICQEYNFVICLQLFEYILSFLGENSTNPTLMSISLAVITSIYKYIKAWNRN